VSNHAVGLRVDSTQCPDGAAACIVNANVVHDNNCQGILLVASSGYTLTQNVARSNGAAPCFPRGGITLVFGSTGNTVVNNDSSHNNDFGIRTGFGNGIGPQTSGNHILNNVAKGNRSPISLRSTARTAGTTTTAAIQSTAPFPQQSATQASNRGGQSLSRETGGARGPPRCLSSWP